MAYSDEKLLTFSADEIKRIYENAKRLASDPKNPFHQSGVDTLAQFAALGIVVPSKQLLLDSPEGKKLQHVIFSNKDDAIQAAKDGLSPMQILDSLLQDALGSVYNAANGATAQAGYVVANMMRQHMWEVKPNARATLPRGCIAKTAALYTFIPSMKRT